MLANFLFFFSIFGRILSYLAFLAQFLAIFVKIGRIFGGFGKVCGGFGAPFSAFFRCFFEKQNCENRAPVQAKRLFSRFEA